MRKQYLTAQEVAEAMGVSAGKAYIYKRYVPGNRGFRTTNTQKEDQNNSFYSPYGGRSQAVLSGKQLLS